MWSCAVHNRTPYFVLRALPLQYVPASPWRRFRDLDCSTPKRLKINAGDEQITQFESGPPKGVRSFCSKCGSHLFCQVEEDVIDIAMASLNGPIDRLPEKHWYYDSRADWVEINDNLPKLGGADGMQPLD